jgi:hypothetical protein
MEWFFGFGVFELGLLGIFGMGWIFSSVNPLNPENPPKSQFRKRSNLESQLVHRLRISKF